MENNKRRIMKTLKCILTESEEKAYGKEMADHETKAEETEQEKAKANKGYDTTIKFHSKGARTIAIKIKNGYEYREVPCDECFDYQRGLVTTIRIDTAEEIEQRAMTAEERQMGFNRSSINNRHPGPMRSGGGGNI